MFDVLYIAQRFSVRPFENSCIHVVPRASSALLCVAFAIMSAGDAAEQARALLENATDHSLTELQRLEHQRNALAAERKRVVRELKNETQKRKRLMQKARNLSTEDLLNVVVGRAAHAKSKAAAAKAKPAAKAVA